MKTKPNIKGKGFEFVESGHSYYLDGVPMTGVTTILSVIAKPALIQWSANEAVRCIKESDVWKRIPNVPLTLSIGDDEFVLLLEQARLAHRKKKEDAGKKGTDVHSIIEDIIKKTIINTHGYIYVEDLSDAVTSHEQVRHFVAWAVENKVKFLMSEEKVYSKELFVAGTIDFVCEIDGEVWIGDIKTSSGIYPEYFFQTAGYQLLMEAMEIPLNIKGHVITCLTKTGEFIEKRSISNMDNRKAFLAALDLYRIQEKIKNNLI